VAVQHQLAEQAAQVKNPNHIEKIVGDLWATGMDEAKINAQGIEPLKADLDRDRRPAGQGGHRQLPAHQRRQG
jgi:predicted metalloendopeptidase